MALTVFFVSNFIYINIVYMFFICIFVYIKHINIMKKISKAIIEKILNDNDFSLDVAKVLQIQQYSVKELAKRNSDKLANYHVVELYKSKGFAVEDIFESE